jgi:hypothetical protein
MRLLNYVEGYVLNPVILSGSVGISLPKKSAVEPRLAIDTDQLSIEQGGDRLLIHPLPSGTLRRS